MILPDFPRIAVDQDICGGRPTVAGTRVRVSDVLEMLAGSASVGDIAADFPYLAEADVQACLVFAARSTDHPIVTAAA